MLIYFVRHGDPDYRNDCLTDLGKEQARLTAERLRDSGIARIFSSTNGRAMQTAQYTADVLGLPIVPCDFMREISFRPKVEEPIMAGGNPWSVPQAYCENKISLTHTDWQTRDPFDKTRTAETAEVVISGFDAWLAELGYTREGEYYRVTGTQTDTTVAMFSHGGSSSAAMSHLFNIPFPQFCGAVDLKHTSVTVVWLADKQNALVYPKFMLLNDAAHIGQLLPTDSFGW